MTPLTAIRSIIISSGEESFWYRWLKLYILLNESIRLLRLHLLWVIVEKRNMIPQGDTRLPPGQCEVLGEPNEYVSMYNNCELLWYIVYMYVHTYKHMYSESMKQTIWKTNIIHLVVAMEPILCRLYLLILLLLLLLFWLYLRFGHGWTVAFFQMAWAWGDVPVSIWI